MAGRRTAASVAAMTALQLIEGWLPESTILLTQATVNG
jgi:hypothetical protein